MHTVEWFQEFLTLMFYLPLLNIFQYSKWFSSSIRPIHGTLTGTTTSGQSGPENNSNEGVHQIPQISRCSLVSYPRHSLRWGGLTSLQRCNRRNLQLGRIGTEWESRPPRPKLRSARILRRVLENCRACCHSCISSVKNS